MLLTNYRNQNGTDIGPNQIYLDSPDKYLSFDPIFIENDPVLHDIFIFFSFLCKINFWKKIINQRKSQSIQNIIHYAYILSLPTHRELSKSIFTAHYHQQ